MGYPCSAGGETEMKPLETQRKTHFYTKFDSQTCLLVSCLIQEFRYTKKLSLSSNSRSFARNMEKPRAYQQNYVALFPWVMTQKISQLFKTRFIKSREGQEILSPREQKGEAAASTGMR